MKTTRANCTSTSPRTTYSYNVVGDRTSQADRTVVGSTATTVTKASTYDAADELLTQAVGAVTTATNTWSVNGTLASSTSSAGTRTFTSDLTDELTSAVLENGTVVGYTTDTHGNRTSRTVNGQLDATWAWDGIAQLPTRVGEFGSTGALTTSWLPDPTSGTGAPLAQSNGSTASWLLGDWAQNITAAVATTGTTVTGTKTLDAFGNARAGATGSLASAAFGFSGQYLDAVTGLYDMRARDYDSTTGRFTAQDPASIATGMPVFASYLYGYANPLMFTDPTGRWPSWDDLYNATADVVNGAASLANAMYQNPLATAVTAVGVWLMVDGATNDAAAAVVTVVTGGPGAVVGVPVAAVGTLEVALGGVLTAVGGVVLIQSATGDCSMQIMQHRDTSAGSGGGDGHLSRGSSATPDQHVKPWSDEEAAALEKVKANPASGEKMQLRAGEMKDPRWPADDGWVKRVREFATEDEDIEIHWVYNEETGVADDFKFVGGPPK